MPYFLACLKEHLYLAEWLVAIGTLLLSFIALYGDAYTRLLKKENGYKFKQKAFEFLLESLTSWGKEFETTTKKTVEEMIDQFHHDLAENAIYLDRCEQRKFVKYAKLAEKFAHSWDNKGPEKETHKVGRKIFEEMESISKQIGKEKDFKRLKETTFKDIYPRYKP